MLRLGYIYPLFAVLVTSLAVHAQTPSAMATAKADYSQEAAVLEMMSTKIAFDNDGNSTREQTSRVRVQTDAGVKQWGLLSFPFQSATQVVDIDYVRVRKADGSTVVTSADNIQDLDAEITRSAPFYSDLREKHVAVKGLGPGDILEYQAHWHTTKPLIPGQFWFQYNFQDDGIVLDEHLEIKVPADRSMKVKGPVATQTVSAAGGSRIYWWSYSKLKKDPEDEKNETDVTRGRRSPPDVQISSFQSWEEVGAWYWSLQQDRVEPTPAIRAKAAELTKGLTDDAARLRALYTFVSTQYRYIGIAFGIGRYQPHTADDVLTNNYGDCKDKHTLLASLLQASGLTLYPALISSSWKVDPDVPSPAQFDHVIGYLPQGKDKDAVWLDTTPEVAPFGFLVGVLRDKQALVMPGGKTAQLMRTPADPPFLSTQSFKLEGKLGDDATLQAKIEDTIWGEVEVPIRAAFRRVGQPQWKDLTQQISYGLGFAGTVSDVSASTPEAINDPLHFSYSYNRKDYPDWANRRFTVPGLPFFMPQLKDDAKYPVWLGSPMETVSESKVELPKGYKPELPPNVDLKYDFAEYHASYTQEQNVLLAKRRMLIKSHEVPVAEFGDYRNFVKNLQNDVNRFVQTSSSHSPGAVNPTVAAATQFAQGIRDLPDSDSQEAIRLEAEGRDELTRHDLQGAISSLYRAVAADPKFARAWVLLGVLLLDQKQVDAGMDAFHKAMAIAPEQPAIPKALGFTLMAGARFEEAVTVWQDYTKAHPDDVDGPWNLGNCLSHVKRYPEAAAAFEAAVKITSDRPNLQANLAYAYLQAGEREKAASAYAKLADANPDEGTLNNVAYEMAKADLDLPLALEYATKAVRAAEDESEKITLADLKVEDLRKIYKVSAYWDTLGWVQERMSKLDLAQRYLLASWKLTQEGPVAGHLCHLYRRTHQAALAIEMCRMAINRIPMSQGLALNEYQIELDAAKENLDKLTGSAAKSKSLGDATDLVIRERNFKLPRFLPGTESAEFFVLLASDGKSKTFKVEDVKFISGSDKMKLRGKQLKSINFNFLTPSDNPTHFVRRGILGCYAYSGCSFVLLDPATEQSLE